jgi:hypothetical protein
MVDPLRFAPKGEVLKAYNNAAEKAGRPLMTSQGFGTAVKRLYPSLEDGQRTVDGRIVGVYRGISLRGDDVDSRVSRDQGASQLCSYRA